MTIRSEEWQIKISISMARNPCLPVLGSKVLVLGLTFEENCPDVRNIKVVDFCWPAWT